MDTNNTFNEQNQQQEIDLELKCSGCGSILKYKPGTPNLICTYCSAENLIQQSEEKIEEIDFSKFVSEQLGKEEKVDVVSVRCNACGASISLDPNITSDQCPYCDSNIVVKSGSTSTILKPKSLIPFFVDKKKASDSFKNWIQGLWFAPGNLKKNSTINEKLNGIYIPYWTYDANTHTDYTGQRGTYYYETETYTEEENGETVTKTREVRHTRWNYVSGHVNNTFDDILVIASKSLPDKYTIKLEPWHLKDLKPYNDKFLSGFRTETYQTDVVQGLEVAKVRMEPEIRQEICRDISGDEQRINTMNVAYNDVTFKHVLLPIWISSYRYNEKVYRFLINGQTGEVQGERPYSAIKITLAILAALAVIALAIILFSK